MAPWRVAAEPLTPVAHAVRTSGASGGAAAHVVRRRSSPMVVPFALCATTRRWYPVAAISPVSVCTTVVSDPYRSGAVSAVLEPYADVGPYSTCAVVGRPDGSTSVMTVRLSGVAAHTSGAVTMGACVSH